MGCLASPNPNPNLEPSPAGCRVVANGFGTAGVGVDGMCCARAHDAKGSCLPALAVTVIRNDDLFRRGTVNEGVGPCG